MNLRRQQLNDFFNGMRETNKILPDAMGGFNAMLKGCVKEGAIDTKTKELISVAIACYSRCEYCIVYHVHQALKLGATVQEIREAAMTSVIFGGGPAVATIAVVLNESIEEFKDDFS